MTSTALEIADIGDKVVSLAKRRGFVFPSSEIYGGAGATWDFGPLGVELKNNVKRAWWRDMTQLRDDVVGLDAAILMHPRVWEASGHVENFIDPLVDCRSCKRRFRIDELADGERLLEAWRTGGADLSGVACPSCEQRALTAPRRFNLMFKTFVGPVEDETSIAWLRPETAQGIYVNFENVQQATRRRPPFGIAQVGKAFRNEITPGNFIFRSREFEQMEMQYFVPPGTTAEHFERWQAERRRWYEELGIAAGSLRFHEHGPGELAHYAARAVDIEFRYPFGWKELEGIHDRGDYDLRRHGEFSGKDLTYHDDVRDERYIPNVVETSGGADRATFAFLCAAYDEEPDKEGVRVVLRLHRDLAPYKVAVLPLSKKPELSALSREVWAAVRPHLMSTYDETQAIGRRYRRQDEIGTPLCVTVDFDSLEDRAVTIRERDSMGQVRVPIAELVPALRERLAA
ncbi:MAG TPA: glycine--tRNA ligase [Candidatus Limnocylindrales bacterium]|nr:glycine--tRNA ligase [Candidatus Limnocylindrales bacterium]